MIKKDHESLQQAAILLMSLSSEESAKVLKYLDPKEVQKIGAVMAQLKNVNKAQVQSSIQKIIEQTNNFTSLGIGTDESIRQMMIGAFGETKGSSVIDSILIGNKEKGLESLQWMESKGIADLIRFEHPQIQALVLCQLESGNAADVLSCFDEKARLDLILRISNQEPVQPTVLEELNGIIERQLQIQDISQSTRLGGVKSAADIINGFEPSVSEALMASLKQQDEELALKLEDLMFIFENILDIDDKGIQSLLREITTDILVLALKGADEEIQNKIFDNMSKRAADLLKDDLAAKGPVRLSEVEAAQKEILMVAKKMADKGEITIGGRGGDVMV